MVVSFSSPIRTHVPIMLPLVTIEGPLIPARVRKRLYSPLNQVQEVVHYPSTFTSFTLCRLIGAHQTNSSTEAVKTWIPARTATLSMPSQGTAPPVQAQSTASLQELASLQNSAQHLRPRWEQPAFPSFARPQIQKGYVPPANQF